MLPRGGLTVTLCTDGKERCRTSFNGRTHTRKHEHISPRFSLTPPVAHACKDSFSNSCFCFSVICKFCAFVLHLNLIYLSFIDGGLVNCGVSKFGWKITKIGKKSLFFLWCISHVTHSGSSRNLRKNKPSFWSQTLPKMAK